MKHFDEKGFRIEKSTKKNMASDASIKNKKIETPLPKIPPKKDTAHIDNIDKILNEYEKLMANKKIWYIDDDIVIFDVDE